MFWLLTASPALACEQAPSEGGKKIRQSKAWLSEGSEWDAGEPVDIVFYTPFRPLVISLLQISQVGN